MTTKRPKRPPLTNAEFQSPKEELEADFSRRQGVLPAHEDKLMNLGYARASDLGPPLTETGKDRIQKGR